MCSRWIPSMNLRVSYEGWAEADADCRLCADWADSRLGQVVGVQMCMTLISLHWLCDCIPWLYYSKHEQTHLRVPDTCRGSMNICAIICRYEYDHFIRGCRYQLFSAGSGQTKTVITSVKKHKTCSFSQHVGGWCYITITPVFSTKLFRYRHQFCVKLWKQLLKSTIHGFV